jgi:hypothetical protein
LDKKTNSTTKHSKKILQQLRPGRSLFGKNGAGKDGAFAPLLKDILEAAMEGELETHLDEEERAAGYVFFRFPLADHFLPGK